ncbi:MAG: radical SAM protein [Oscillospiraceae bacterium]|nr:radical SAM protein [Oscillospiraceae bacterium]
MTPRTAKLSLEHPCFSEGKPNNKGRIHLPVSPACNIACAFCSRAMNADRDVQRPGVTGEVLTPQEALELVRRAVAIAPEITVVGIAGPGDTLATPHALETFRLVKREFPNLLRCMSTNGLLLPEKTKEIIEVGIDTLTVTVNAVDPDILRQIVYGVRPEILIRNQLEGIRRLSAAGVTVKVNTVLVPGVNDRHIEVTACTVAEAGATVYNIIPLIPQNKLSHLDAPTCAEIDEARLLAEKHLRVFRHCQHCRADAVGVPGGKDYGEALYAKRVSQENTFSHG